MKPIYEHNIDLKEIARALADRKIYGTGYLQIIDDKIKRIDPRNINLVAFDTRNPDDIFFNSKISSLQQRSKILAELMEEIANLT